ncbi:antibiotic biosynthesis monooxygenase family protein [Streptomyces sp. 8N706]|uniref:antibiotic biosynthesis monooxygenase family protein n=1 Tax=Streptomyces sp. 8N706 TaxID=3457416 RepID=UPI003FD11D66
MTSAQPQATAADATTSTDTPVRVIFMITVPEENTERFLTEYDAISRRVAQVPGHIEDQVARSTTEPDRWVITSLWENGVAFAEWERSPEHRTLVGPMRACFTEPVSLRFAVQRHTR